MKLILSLYALALSFIYNFLIDTARKIDKYIDQLEYEVATPEERLLEQHKKTACYKAFRGID
jgi:hypothetical protein